MKGTIRTPLPVPAVALADLSVVGDVAGATVVPAPQGRLPRAAVAVHVLTLAAALGVWGYLDRNLWFFGDEWDFLTRRGLHGATFSIWAPHNEHWSVLPILLWRAIFSIVHLSAYWPYLVPVLLVHVVVVHLVWRRSILEGANVWVASGVALLMALFGTGAEDLTWAFQIGFVASAAFGLLALEAADWRPGQEATGQLLKPLFSSARLEAAWARDGAVAVLALAALMCSDIGIAVCAAIALVLFVRGGAYRAVRALLLPAASYALWFALAGHKGLASTGDTLGLSIFSKVPTFVATNLEMDLGHAAGLPRLRYALFALVALWLVWQSRRLYREHPAVLGGVVAAVAFYALAGLGRDRISATMSPSRYAYIGSAFLFPAVALMISAFTRPAGLLSRRSRPRRRSGGLPRSGLTPLLEGVAVVALLAATAANAHAGAQFARSRTAFVGGLRNQIVTSAYLLQDKGQLGRAINPYPVWASGFAAGYLTPWELAHLYTDHYVGSPAASLMTVTQVREDESWLDLTARRSPISLSRFSLVGVHYRFGAKSTGRAENSGQRVRSAREELLPRAAYGWPSGPGRCIFTDEWLPPGTAGEPATTLKFSPSGPARPAALWISLGPRGGRVHFYLRHVWGFRGRRGSGNAPGETVDLSANSYLWLNDSVAASGLGLSVPAGRQAEVCGLRQVAVRTA